MIACRLTIWCVLSVALCLSAHCLSAMGSETAVDSVAKSPDIVYLNPCVGGCAITVGPDDALNHVSSILEHNVTVPQFAYSDDVLNGASACTNHTLSPFNIHVVLNDPGVQRKEIILSTVSSGAGFNNDTIPVIAPFSGLPEPNTLAFVFASIEPEDVDFICWSIVTVVGNLYGLDRVNECSDVMSYSTGCGEKSFTNIESTCNGTVWDTPGFCFLGNSTQNSFVDITNAVGAKDAIFTNSLEAFEIPHAGPSP